MLRSAHAGPLFAVPHRHDALRRYRGASAPLDAVGLPAAFVLCSDSSAASAFVATLAPALVVQNAAPGRPGDRSLADAVAVALTLGEAPTSIIVCAHTGCILAPPPRPGESRLVRARDEALARSASVRNDAVVGPFVADGRMKLAALVFDEREGDVYRIDPASAALDLLSDLALDAFLDEVGGPSAVLRA